MENGPFTSGNHHHHNNNQHHSHHHHLQSQALVVLSEAASGLHEALQRNHQRHQQQTAFQTRLPDGKDHLHNMSLVGSYGSHLLHNFHPHLLQSLNPSVLTNPGNGHGNFFSSNDSRSIVKPISLSSFQLPSAFSPPKYIGINLEQNLFSGNESFRTDSTSPTCTSVSPPSIKNDSLEGQMIEYDSDKIESPRSNSDSREFVTRHVHNIKSDPTNRNTPPDICPVCGIHLSLDEWNAHFLTELDRLYKLSSGMDRSNLLFGLCPSQDNSIRTSHNRWETFQRIRTNRQSRLRIKVRKRKCGSDLYFLENLFCSSCPVCRRKFPLDSIKNVEEEQNVRDEIETVDVESCSDDVPDSGSDLSGSNKMIDGVLYKNVCLINKETGDDSISNGWETHTNVKNANELSSTTQPQYYNADSCADMRNEIMKHDSDTNICSNESDEDVIVDDDNSSNTTTQVRITSANRKRKFDDNNGDSSSIPEGTTTTTTTTTQEDEQNSEPQVTSTEQTLMQLNRYPSNSSAEDMRIKLKDPSESPDSKMMATTTTVVNNSGGMMGGSNNSNNNNSKTGAVATIASTAGIGVNAVTTATFAANSTATSITTAAASATADEEYKCFICKTGLEKCSSYFRGRKLYFHQSCANVMSNFGKGYVVQ